MNSPLASLLIVPPEPLPLFLSRFEIAVAFTPAYAGSEDRDVIDDAFGELDALLRAGFSPGPVSTGGPKRGCGSIGATGAFR